MDPGCDRAASVEELVDYLLGELPEEQEARLEEHYFACEHCARRLESVERLGAGVADLVRKGSISASVTADVVARAADDGLTLREYSLHAGTPIECTAGPEDDFVVVRLTGPFGTDPEVSLMVDTEDLRDGALSGSRRMDVAVDRGNDEIVLLFAGDTVRSFPRSRWTMNVETGPPDRARRVGPFVMNHTPWAEIA